MGGHVASGSRAGGPPASCGEGWSLAISGREDARVIAEQHIHALDISLLPRAKSMMIQVGRAGWQGSLPVCCQESQALRRWRSALWLKVQERWGCGRGVGGGVRGLG